MDGSTEQNVGFAGADFLALWCFRPGSNWHIVNHWKPGDSKGKVSDGAHIPPEGDSVDCTRLCRLPTGFQTIKCIKITSVI